MLTHSHKHRDVCAINVHTHAHSEYKPFSKLNAGYSQHDHKYRHKYGKTADASEGTPEKRVIHNVIRTTQLVMVH